jgi:hypothetical protein
LKIYCAYTPSHEVLLRDWFMPSVPREFEVIQRPLPIVGAGDFASAEFLAAIAEKVRMISESITDNPGDWIVWSDVDIVFFRRAAARLAEAISGAGMHQLLFQREFRGDGDVNGGFIAIRCTDAVRAFFDEVGERLIVNPGKNEQDIYNVLLREPGVVEWGWLPKDFVARSHGWPPRRVMSIYHANCTAGPGGIEQKLRQFRLLPLIGLPTYIDGWLNGWRGHRSPP